MVRLATQAMGTRFEIALWGEDEVGLRAVGEECLREIELWHGRLSRFAPDSEAVRLSRDPSARVDGEMAGLLELCERVREGSGGAFDVRCGAAGGLDFGAVGKGWALDRVVEILREHGVTTALVHGGTSSVAAIGSPPGADGWRVDVRSDGVPLRRVLRDRVMGVSAPKRNRDVTHILDPRTGAPASRVDTAVVIGPVGEDAAGLCDAWSTALVVLGERESGVDCTGIKMPVPPGIAVPLGFEAYIHTSTGWQNLTPTLMGAA